jgi:hypothetical protein
MEKHKKKIDRPRFICCEDGCNHTTFSASAIVKHQRTVHNNFKPAQKSFVCECGEMFETKDNFLAHVKSAHKKIKEHACAHCSKKFYFKKLFDEHMETHVSLIE